MVHASLNLSRMTNVTRSFSERHRPVASITLYCLLTEADQCEQLVTWGGTV